jgi:hypothetical protein
MAAEAAGGELPVVLTGGFARTPGAAWAVEAELEPLRRHAALMAPSVAREPELAVLRGCVIIAASAGPAEKAGEPTGAPSASLT